jgi:hypothetical protein
MASPARDAGGNASVASIAKAAAAREFALFQPCMIVLLDAVAAVFRPLCGRVIAI